MNGVLEYLEGIWKKPEHVRRAIATGIVAVIMAVILGVWIFTFSLPSFSGPETVTTAEGNATPDQLSPFSLLWEATKQTASPLWNLIKNSAKNVL